MIRRVLAIVVLVIVTALLLQSTVFAELRLLGVRPELLFLVTIVIALLEGPNEGAVVGFACGMAQDFFLDQPKGITALTLTLLGYAVGMAQYIVSPSPLVPTIVVAIRVLNEASTEPHRSGWRVRRLALEKNIGAAEQPPRTRSA